MKQLIRAACASLVLLSFLFAATAQAQVQTARTDVPVGTKCKGYYEYLPPGYDPNGSTTYPLLVFMSGVSEMGNGSATQLPRILKWGPPQMIAAGTFPTTFTAGGQTHGFIIISPQFTSTPIIAADVDAVINYMVAHYKVNTNRIYLTGLSYGGGLSFAHPGRSAALAARIAAIVPIASTLPLPKETGYDTIYARSRVIAAGNVPVWATHNSGDADSVSHTIAYINGINEAPAPNPLAKMTIFNAGGHDAWTKTYDTTFRENGYNVFEWMLLHQKGSPPPAPNNAPTVNVGADKTVTLPTNSITLTGSATDNDGTIAAYSWIKVSGPINGTITSPRSATTTVTGLVRGVYIFRLMVSDNVSAKALDDIKVTVGPAAGTKLIQVNVYGGSSGYSTAAPNYWNNWNVGTVAATNKTSSTLKYVDGTTATGVTATLSATTAVKDNGSTYASIAIAPKEVLRHASQHDTLRTLTISGLSNAKKYNLEFYASYSSTASNNNTVFTINGASQTVNVNNNLTNKAAFANITPDASGNIVVSINKTGSYNYLNGFIIEESTGTTITKYVNTNIYGGTNAYNNAAWNNWNVGTVAANNKSISALKYSDGTASTVGALLSRTEALGDNGSTYGGTMAPAEVLRYCSNGLTSRTLTLSGLSTTKTYNVELYASRAKTGYSTVFTIGAASVTIVTDSNKTNAAVFSNLTANASGQIVVTLQGGGAPNNYLNGFVLTEITTSGSAAAPLTNRQLLEAPAQKPTSISLTPNPVNSRALLTVNNGYTGALQVQVVDATGKSQKSFRLVKSSAVLQQVLPLSDLPKGVYFVTVQMGSQRQSVTLSKF